jgi:hypothetical protein
MRGQEHDLMTVRETGGNQFVVLFNADGDDAARHHIAEVFERGLLYSSVASNEEDELILLFKIADGQHGARCLSWLQ